MKQNYVINLDIGRSSNGRTEAFEAFRGVRSCITTSQDRSLTRRDGVAKIFSRKLFVTDSQKLKIKFVSKVGRSSNGRTYPFEG